MANLEEISESVFRLESTSIERKQIRRRLFKFVREFYFRSSYNDLQLERKMRYCYLGDLSDRQLLCCVQEICEGLPASVSQH